MMMMMIYACVSVSQFIRLDANGFIIVYVSIYICVGTYVVLSFMDSIKNIMKDSERTSMNERNTLLHKNISLSFYSRKGHTVCCKFERWRDIYIEKGLLLAPYLLPRARRCKRWHPLASHIVRDDTKASDRLRIPGSTLDSHWSLNLTARFSYHVVSFRLHICLIDLPCRTAIPCLLITTWQLVKTHGVTKNEPKIHNDHYIKHIYIHTYIYLSIYLSIQASFVKDDETMSIIFNFIFSRLVVIFLLSSKSRH